MRWPLTVMRPSSRSASSTRPMVGRVTRNCSISASYVGSREPGAYRPARICSLSDRAMASTFRDGIMLHADYHGGDPAAQGARRPGAPGGSGGGGAGDGKTRDHGGARSTFEVLRRAQALEEGALDDEEEDDYRQRRHDRGG